MGPSVIGTNLLRNFRIFAVMKKRALLLRSILGFCFLLLTTEAAAQIVPPEVSIENDLLARYLDDSDYDPADYSYTHLDRYIPEMYGQFDKPRPVTFTWERDLSWKNYLLEIYDLRLHGDPVVRHTLPADTLACHIYNLIPGREYAYALMGQSDSLLFPLEEGTFLVKGRRRMIRADFVTNIRDFGGLRTEDGKTLRYGRLFRGAAFDHIRRKERSALILPEGIAVLRDELRVGAEIDLRSDKELLLLDKKADNDMDNSMLGPDVEYYHCPISDFGAFTTDNLYGPPIATIVDCLQRGLNVYFHCAAGADRTGVLSFLLAAMAGVCENDLAREYEITDLALGRSARHTRNSTGAYNYGPSIDYLKTNFQGATLAEKVQNYLILKHHVTREQIETLQRILVE